MPAPLELTDQQKRDFLKQKTDLFLSELKKIETLTGSGSRIHSFRNFSSCKNYSR